MRFYTKKELVEQVLFIKQTMEQFRTRISQNIPDFGFSNMKWYDWIARNGMTDYKFTVLPQSQRPNHFFICFVLCMPVMGSIYIVCISFLIFYSLYSSNNPLIHPQPILNINYTVYTHWFIILMGVRSDLF